ncbi:SprT family zinc-dependent metalloprotease [Moellerella wisconsensis]|uniref:SprT family zinc-dependent metalloprotease n=1 Tax=Moellerella wisconsensis TaxID=158849 RepID=A0ACD3Y5A5_9GAMM|nr:SprT family zinc-dependent metalloprotease [Moellerella wisconsensis]UNH38150.1 SprT family zinc-dependent metalloprotease [Moellerella wisconsensis]UNH41645.1 SprT family zinc-dependent metalloprotease [Moellerella wisconsensis]WJW81159.1 SprT family zinc-dependent metalloprotease [Moellerella wisconsensis]
MKIPRVPLTLQLSAMRLLREKLALASNKLEKTFTEPTLNYRQRGTTAGSAYLAEWQIRLNPVLLIENGEAFIQEVIPHELAHLLVYRCFGRVGITPHGKEWQWMMQEVLEVTPQRTHKFSVESVKSQGFMYHCRCPQPHELSLRRHNKVQRGTSQYLCRKCKEPLSWLATPQQKS